ncbi:MAG: AAA family ATPase, partial [bacterium]|nr:AAA family ATPase [bacterium]
MLLTGQAGTGKTYLLNRFIDYLKDREIRVGLTASTGIAATHLGGQTIHSWAGFGIKDRLTDNDLTNIINDLNISERLLEAKVLIIDEISMLHSYQLDMVDQIARAVREDGRPFGGLQIVLCGDFYQLPPVAKDQWGGKFVTDSSVWKKMNIQICYLCRQYRQADTKLLTILNEIRGNCVSNDSISRLAGRVYAGFPAGVESTKLYTHNAIADAYNLDKLEKIESKSQTYHMKHGGNIKIVRNLIRDCLAPEELILKKGAVVMFVRNNMAKGYVNGTTGRVVGFNDDDFPVIEIFSSKKKVTAEPEKWKVEDGAQIVAWIAQIPLRLAWAITVHKSQGMTLEYVEIDLSRAFTYSLGYVALSRA